MTKKEMEPQITTLKKLKSCQIEFLNSKVFEPIGGYGGKLLSCTLKCPNEYLRLVIELRDDQIDEIYSQEYEDKLKSSIIGSCKNINCSFVCQV